MQIKKRLRSSIDLDINDKKVQSSERKHFLNFTYSSTVLMSQTVFISLGDVQSQYIYIYIHIDAKKVNFADFRLHKSSTK